MMEALAQTRAPAGAQDERRWQAVESRDGDSDGAFVYGVMTTGVYCRPSCPSRRPKRENVAFFALNRDAEAAGLRPCKRCRPHEASLRQRHVLAVETACRTLETSEAAPTLAELSRAAGLSPHHFQRTFKSVTGLTPRQYHAAHRSRRTVSALAREESVTEAAFAGGFQSLSAFYDAAARRHGLAPSAMRRGAPGEAIAVGRASSALGTVTAAFSRSGLVAVRLTDSPCEGMAQVAALFAHALVLEGGADFDALVAEVARAVDEPALAPELPLDIRGTAFEERVWAALRKIPVASTATYGEIAEAVGQPGAHRAVARACGANRIAVLIPCHRVVRADGSLAGYRWGPQRKAALLAAEARWAADAG